MSTNKPFEIRSGDTLVVLTAELTRRNTSGVLTAADLTGLTVTFSLVNAADGTVLIDEAAATVVTAASGIVSFDFSALQTATPGIYWGTFRVIDTTEPASFPVNPKQGVVLIHGDDQTAEEAYRAAVGS